MGSLTQNCGDLVDLAHIMCDRFLAHIVAENASQKSLEMFRWHRQKHAEYRLALSDLWLARFTRSSHFNI